MKVHFTQVGKNFAALLSNVALRRMDYFQNYVTNPFSKVSGLFQTLLEASGTFLRFLEVYQGCRGL